jgi:hypothetical protein
MVPPRSDRSVAILVACWTTVCVALGVLLASLNSLPESVPVFVSPMGTPTMWAPKSIPMVTRLAIMGMGQLGAVTGLALASNGGGYSGWARFFEVMAVAVASKTLVESVNLAGTGSAWGEMTAPALHAATIAIVVTFLVSALWMWRKGVFRGVPTVTSRRMRTAIVFSVAVWLAFATIPYWW